MITIDVYVFNMHLICMYDVCVMYFDAFIMVLCEYVQIAISTPIPITNSVKSLVYRRMCVNQNSHFIKLFMEISHFLQ